MFSLKCLDAEESQFDLLREVPEIGVPVVFCAGRRDFLVPSGLVVEYAEKLRAPSKRIVWFEHSGHAANFEEPARFCDVCISLLPAEPPALTSAESP